MAFFADSSKPREEKTQRPIITLRSFRSSDLDNLVDIMTDDQVTLYTDWKICKSRDEVVHFLNTTILPHPWFRAVCLDDRPVGCVYVDRGTGLNRYKAQVGHCYARRYWGRGVGRTALQTAVAAVFEEWPDLERLEGAIPVENVGAQRVAEALGFEREGLLRRCYFKMGRFWDVYIYACLRRRPTSRI